MTLHQPPRTRSYTQLIPLALLALAVLLYAVYFSYLTILRFHAFESRALDMGNLHQAIWNTAHGNWFRMTNQEVGLTSRLSMHVEPILLPIAALYRLFPGVETLLVLQATVVALGALPLFALALRLKLNDWAALAFAVAYLLNPTIQAANWLEFHPVTLAPTFLMAAFYFLVARRNLWFVVIAVLAASCKEEIGLLVAMLGVYAILAQRRWTFGLLTIFLAGGWSLLAVLGIQAAFAGGNIHWGRYAYLGDTTSAKLISLLTRPDLIVAQLGAAGVGRYFFELLLPVGFLSLLAPEVLLLALPSLAINLLAQFSPMHQVTTLIYAAPILPFVMLSAVRGAARLQDWVERAGAKEGSSSAGNPQWARFTAWLVPVWVLAFAAAGQLLYGYLPPSGNHMVLEVTDHHRRSAAVFDQIPPTASVSAQDRLNPHVAGRETLSIFPRVENADYVLLDVTGSAWPQHPNDLRRDVDKLLAEGYGVAAADDGYLLLAKGNPNQAPGPDFYTAWQAGAPLPDAVPVGAEFGGQLRPLRFYTAYFESKGQVLQDSIYYQPVSVLWYPTSMWPPGERTLVQTLPWRPDTDEFVLGAGVYEGEDGWTAGRRLPVTNAGGIPVLEGGTLLRLGGFQRAEDGPWEAQPAVGGVFAELPLQALDVVFGESLALDAGGLPSTARAGELLPLRLVWERSAAAPPNLSRFVHVLDAEGNKVAQVDGTVADGLGPLPIESWPQGNAVDDLVEIPLPADLLPGEYTIVAGLYDWQSGERLPAGGGTARPDGSALLGAVELAR